MTSLVRNSASFLRYVRSFFARRFRRRYLFPVAIAATVIFISTTILLRTSPDFQSQLTLPNRLYPTLSSDPALIPDNPGSITQATSERYNNTTENSNWVRNALMTRNPLGIPVITSLRTERNNIDSDRDSGNQSNSNQFLSMPYGDARSAITVLAGSKNGTSLKPVVYRRYKYIIDFFQHPNSSSDYVQNMLQTSITLPSGNIVWYITMPPGDLCDTGSSNGAPPQMVTVVHTAPENYERRTEIRETWGNREVFPGNVVVFAMGWTNDTLLQMALRLEQDLYHDILQGAFMDCYRNITFKAIMWLQWLREYCPSTLVLKVDDDVVVNIPKLRTLIDHLRSTRQLTQRSIACYVWPETAIIRHPLSKWNVGMNEFPGVLYPPYCAGMAYILTEDMVQLLYDAVFRNRFFWVDDVYITGILPLNIANFTYFELNPFYGMEDDVEFFMVEGYVLFGHIPNDSSRTILQKKLLPQTKPARNPGKMENVKPKQPGKLEKPVLGIPFEQPGNQEKPLFVSSEAEKEAEVLLKALELLGLRPTSKSIAQSKVQSPNFERTTATVVKDTFITDSIGRSGNVGNEIIATMDSVSQNGRVIHHRHMEGEEEKFLRYV